MQQVNLGIIGAGTVGGGVLAALDRNGALLASRLGVRLEVTRVAVRDRRRRRTLPVRPELVTEDWRQVVHNPDVHVVVELMGGTTTAREVALAALRHGKPVVTANKALLSGHGEELFAEARANNANLYYEASVAGGIPIIKILREALVGNRILSIHGIVNGTCNYILTRMKLEGAPFDTVLADAQRLGYAEAEPSLDIDGRDAAQKTGILASLAHGFWIQPDQISTEGIRHVTQVDMRFAAQLGYTIKLLGVVKVLPTAEPAAASRRAGKRPVRTATPTIQVAVYPALIPDRHVLASVNYAFNAVAVRGDVVGETLFYGRGAGSEATASSVLSDLADAALDLKHGSHERVPAFVAHAPASRIAPPERVASRFYVRLTAIDRPGVFASIAGVLGRSGISISSIIQPEGHQGGTIPVILMTHEASLAGMHRALDRIARLGVVRDRPVMMRVETFD